MILKCFLGFQGKNSSNEYSIKIVNSKKTNYKVGFSYKYSKFNFSINSTKRSLPRKAVSCSVDQEILAFMDSEGSLEC
jgi:hypothetical protein